MCDYCKKSINMNTIKVNQSPSRIDTQITEAMIYKGRDDEKYGIILHRRGLAQGWFDINFCPICGRDLNIKVDDMDAGLFSEPQESLTGLFKTKRKSLSGLFPDDEEWFK